MTLGVAVIGAGMAGRAHAAGYRNAATVYAPVLPPVRLVSIADLDPASGALAARRFGYERSDTSWQAVAAATDIDVVSVVVANALHREIVEGLLDAGKHVLCEKPLSDTLQDARAMAAAAEAAGTLARVGFTYRRAPGIAYLRELVTGVLGPVLHVSGRYWTDYGCSPQAPMSWRYRGAPGSGALADVGSHVAYVAEFVGGRIGSVSGGRLSTVITERPLPLGHVSGHAHAAVGDTYEVVTNDDYAAFTVEFEHGAGAIEVSRVAAGHPNSLVIEVFCQNGAARFDQRRPAEIELFVSGGPAATNGYRQVLLGPEHPYLAAGLAMDAPGVGFGQNDTFTYQARAFLEEVAGIDGDVSLPRCASFAEGVHNLELLAAVARSAALGGAAVSTAPEGVFA